MIKIEAKTLEEAYANATSSLECSITELLIEVVQQPTNGILGFFKKNAIIVVAKKEKEVKEVVQEKTISEEKTKEKEVVETVEEKPKKKIEKEFVPKTKKATPKTEVKKAEPKQVKVEKAPKKEEHTILNDTIMPTSFVSMQEEDEEDILPTDTSSYLADYEDDESDTTIEGVAKEVQSEINKLFDFTCFNIETINVTAYDENTLLIEFQGDDSALLIGKEGYRYKALSYMLFNWINSKYQVQLRLEIAEFLKNQEESVARYLESVYESVDKDGRAQTKILDGVLIQIALRELRDRYTDKYVVIRSTRDGLKYIIINDYHSR